MKSVVKVVAVVIMVVTILATVRYYRRQIHAWCAKTWPKLKNGTSSYYAKVQKFAIKIWDGKPIK